MDHSRMMFGRRLNAMTMMWEFSDRSGVAVPNELMPAPNEPVRLIDLPCWRIGEVSKYIDGRDGFERFADALLHAARSR